MEKKIFKKSLCLLTVWMFILSQLAYAGLYKDILNLPSSQDMPKSSPGWRNSKFEPIYDPEYSQIEPALPPDDEWGSLQPTGIWDWLFENVVRPVKEHLIEPLAKFLTGFITAYTSSPQTEPTPVPATSSQQPPTPTSIQVTPTPVSIPVERIYLLPLLPPRWSGGGSAAGGGGGGGSRDFGLYTPIPFPTPKPTLRWSGGGDLPGGGGGGGSRGFGPLDEPPYLQPYQP